MDIAHIINVVIAICQIALMLAKSGRTGPGGTHLPGLFYSSRAFPFWQHLTKHPDQIVQGLGENEDPYYRVNEGQTGVVKERPKRIDPVGLDMLLEGLAAKAEGLESLPDKALHDDKADHVGGKVPGQGRLHLSSWYT